MTMPLTAPRRERRLDFTWTVAAIAVMMKGNLCNQTKH